jgi:tetratricopeptide (TPR) repeat protein
MTQEVLSQDSISPDEVRCQLDRLLASRRFAASERSATFLRYVVDRTLAGDSAGIKEVVIATEIYGRSTDYDPKIDSVVRVEASRMRAKLKSYYTEEGLLDPVVISIPKGGYVPLFAARGNTELERELPLEVTPALPKLTRKGSRMFPALLAAAMILSVWLAPRFRSNGHSDLRNPEAVAAWQEGNDLLALDPHTAISDRGMPATLQRALDRYEFAVARDPGFARAWSSLAEAYDYAAAYVGRDANEDESRAEAAARRAVALDSKSAAGYAILGLTLMCWRWNWAEAEIAYRRALALDPRSAYAVVEFVDLLRQTGRWKEAENVLGEARALQPDSPVLANKQAELELERGRFDAAVSTAKLTIRLKSDYGRAYVVLGAAYERNGQLAEALAAYRAAAAMPGEQRRALPALGYLLGRLGQIEEARSVLRQLIAMNSNVRNCAFQIAVVYTGMGEQDIALDWLETAIRTHQAAAPFAVLEYRFQSLRQFPRFRAMIQQLGLPM